MERCTLKSANPSLQTNVAPLFWVCLVSNISNACGHQKNIFIIYKYLTLRECKKQILVIIDYVADPRLSGSLLRIAAFHVTTITQALCMTGARCMLRWRRALWPHQFPIGLSLCCCRGALKSIRSAAQKTGPSSRPSRPAWRISCPARLPVRIYAATAA